MAKFKGNIFNRAAGSIGGQTFSQARYRGGKIQTGRQRVSPHNPQTIPQTKNRNRYKLVSIEMSGIAKKYINAGFRGSKGRLAPFQALQSIILSVTYADDPAATIIETPRTVINPGVHAPDTFSISKSGTDVKWTWSTENGDDGDITDRVITIFFGLSDSESVPGQYLGASLDIGQRQDGSKKWTPSTTADEYDGCLGALFILPVNFHDNLHASSVKWSRLEL